jgi:radical SAM superfamily enzyme YgiQ (UPF0313 family)
MGKSIYLINPASDSPGYFTAEVYGAWGLGPAAMMADLAIPTVAGMVPKDFDVRICDESVCPIDFDMSVDFVGITGKISQWGRMVAIAREFRQRGKTVLIGGSYASLSPEIVRSHCDILVQGEMENTFQELFSDLRAGRWKTEYIGDRPDLTNSVMPNWAMYPNERAVMGAVQTSRGCPFECEFCDVIQYLGRRQRHKSVSQVLRELDEVYRYGHRYIFLADDNFTAHRARTKELLAALRKWNVRQDRGHVRFVTQVSIDAAKDEDLLKKCSEAGLTQVFVGIETPNEDSLRETKKRQNLKVNLVEQIQHFLDHGISVTGGMIVGFDSDGPDIFERQYQFAMSTPIPIFSVGALVAPAQTPLYARMIKEGRIVSSGSEVAAAPWSTNIVPRQLTSEQLLQGIKWLCNSLYRPSAFGERVLRFIDSLGGRQDPQHAEGIWQARSLRTIESESIDLLSNLIRLGPGEQVMWTRIRKGISRKPESAEFVIPMLVQYLQIRYMYEHGHFWDSHLPSGLPYTLIRENGLANGDHP